MSSVLPIDTQRYESGDYTLEVTAHPSPLSQWSDPPVIRQLRFSLWSEQPERQRLLTGDQHQLVTVNDAVETYVQSHLTQQAWPLTHRLLLLEQELELSTLQLFDLAEVLNAYERGQIILPAMRQKQRQTRRRPQRWWPGSAVASMLAAVGVITAYFHYRPAAFNEVATTQAPADILEDDVAVAPEANAVPEAGAAAPQLEQAPAEDRDGQPQLKTNRELFQPPLDSAELESVELTPAPTTPTSAASTEAGARFSTPSADVPATLKENRSEEHFLEQDRLDNAVPEEIPPETTATPREQIADDEAVSESEPIATAEAVREQEQQESLGDAQSRIEAPNMVDVLNAIAAQLAPYQPTEVNYPLVYHLQVAPDGEIITIDPIGENVPMIEVSGETITPAPGRSLKIEIIYTENNRPVVNEL
ncbi:MAG: DUF4335 domain-containing protein [Cyanobacteria bacterium P01_F01_bin.13]